MLSHFLRASGRSTELIFVGVAEAVVTSNENNLTISYPANAQTGDLALLCLTVPANLGLGYTSTGWTSLSVESNDDVQAQLFYRTIGTTGSQSFTKTGTAPERVTYLLAVFRNATYSSFAEAEDDGAPNPPQLIGTFNAVVVFGNIDNADSAITPPSGYITLGEIASGSITTCGAYRIGAATNPNPGSFGNVSSNGYIAYTIGLT